MKDLDCSEIVKIFRKAKSYEDFIIPDGVKLKVDTHSTASHCYVYLTSEGNPDLLVWYKTNWSSSVYEFNENGKTIGLQDGCDFALPIIEKLIKDAQEVIEFHRIADEQEKQKEETLRTLKEENLLNHYKQKYGR